MILVESINELIELAIYSAYLKGEKPVSLLLCASPEAGKTKVVEQYKGNQGLEYIADCTPVGLVEDYQDKLGNGEIKHFIFTDLITPISKSVEARNGLIAFLNGMTEEGLYNIHTKFMHRYIDLKIQSPKPVGIIACIAPNPLRDNRHQWANVGFMSRLIPVSWSYTLEAKTLILESILKRSYLADQSIKLDLPDSEIGVNLDYEHSKKLYGLVTGLNLDTGNNPYGFRLTKQLQTLTLACALKDGRETVNSADVNKVYELSRFMNLSEDKIKPVTNLETLQTGMRI